MVELRRALQYDPHFLHKSFLWLLKYFLGEMGDCMALPYNRGLPGTESETLCKIPAQFPVLKLGHINLILTVTGAARRAPVLGAWVLGKEVGRLIGH